MKKTRKTELLYRVQGRELQNQFALDHAIGCYHNCKYPCFALEKAIEANKSSAAEWTNVKLVENSLELLKTEIPLYKDELKIVFMCHNTDPFMYGDEFKEISKMSFKIIELLNSNGVECTIITKGVLPDELANLSDANRFGITFNTLDENLRKKLEPNAAPLTERLNGLYNLHKKGMKTWVSLKPYLTPDIITQDLGDILDAIEFVDRIAFGNFYLNSHNINSKFIDFNREAAMRIVEYCELKGKGCYIEKGILIENFVK